MPRKPNIAPLFVSPGPSAATRAVVLYPELIGLVLRHYRKVARVNQADLARDLAWPQPKISRLERGDAHLTVVQLNAIICALNARLPLAGEERIQQGIVYSRADKFADDLIMLDYAVVWCIGSEWQGPQPLLRGDQLKATLALAHVPFEV